ncbi:hypothetical protein [Halobacterium zhouii]|uniref:hypothetical protein n=1 Tax=Halobacterium zhouii TaxID=2902624 RepID=UPI001E5459E0|nr:hypothetical protein [Halobacterium zhouii]
MNRRTLTQWLGAALFVFAAAGLAVTFPPHLFIGFQMVLMAVAGALLFAGGVTNRVRWSLLSGLGNVALGLSLAVSGGRAFRTEGGTSSAAYGVAVVIGGLSLTAIGVLYVIEHDAFDTDP